MGRKQNRTAIWNSFKHTKRIIRDKGHINSNSNVYLIDPEEQKQKKLARKLAEKLKPKQPSKKQLQKLRKLQEKKAKEHALKTALSELEQHRLTDEELALLVAIKHKETKKERLRRLYLTKKAGIDIDDSELYIIKSTPSQIMQLKNPIQKKFTENTINRANIEEQTVHKSQFNFGNIAQNTLNSSIPGAMDKEYKLQNGVTIISTRKTLSRKRSKNDIILIDKTDEKEENEQEDQVSEASDTGSIQSPPQKKQKRITFGGLKSKQTVQLQAFLECDSDDDTLMINTEKQRQRKFTVKVDRLPHIIESRMKLPIIGEEYKIMECIAQNDVVLICGETGSGKSTQLPQFLYEAGYSFNDLPGMIGVTEPRRVAAISVSQRVGVELNNDRVVRYQIRYDSQITPDTRIKFMTDGILLREIQFDFLLNKYSVIILDEAHERNLNSDVLIGLLSRIVKQRRALYERYVMDKGNELKTQKRLRLSPLKLIIMSATLNVDDFIGNLHLFSPSPPVINIPSRQYDVVTHWSKSTPMSEEEYEEELFEKICKIHVLLPKGHMLVFLTGRRQIEYVCNRLRERFKHPTAKTFPVYEKNKKEQHYDKYKQEKKLHNVEKQQCEEEKVADMINNNEDDEEDDDRMNIHWKYKAYAPVNVLPLYSLLSPDKQASVFERQDRNTRLIVVATNIAETSITIPGIRYVVDCGRVKQEKYSSRENMSKLVVEFISKSSAKQRAGRSGRTGPGHCYCLYSSNFFDKWMVDHFEPEILRVPIENIILRMKAMNIKSISSFPFPTRPPQDTIFSGLRILEILGALRYCDEYNSESTSGTKHRVLRMLRNTECLRSDEDKLEITDLGKTLIEYPISVRCAKMLVLGFQGNCLPFVLAICCVLSVESLQFQPDEMDKILAQKLSEMESFKNDKEKQRWHRKEKRNMVLNARNKFANNKSDILSFLNIFGAFKCSRNKHGRYAFCKEHYIRYKNMEECNSLMIQLQKIIYKIYSDGDDTLGFNVKLPSAPPSNVQQILLRQIIASGLMDQIARKWPQHEIPNDDDWVKSKRNYLFLKKAYQCMAAPNKPVFIHPSSYIYASSANDDEYSSSCQPQFVVYYSLNKTETVSVDNAQREGRKIYMRYVTAIESNWLLNIAPHLCIVSDPLESPKPFYDEVDDEIKCYVEVRFGAYQWELPTQSIKYPDDDDGVYRWFARLLLEGKIFTDLKCIIPYLQHRPSIITDNKYSIVSNKAVIGLIDVLKQYKIDSKHKLKLSLTKNGANFLFPQMKLFVYNIKQYVLKKAWPPTK